MLRIGLTGGIGSGKSTVAKIFADLGIEVIDADKIVHELLKPNTTTYVSIVNHFGKACLNGNNELNRKYIRRIIFSHPLERKWLEELTHPQVFAEIERRAQSSKSKYCLLVIPLLLEVHSTALKHVDRVLVIDSSDENRTKRIIKRDGIERCEVEAIMKAQLSNKERLTKADDVIHNDSSLENLKAQILALHQQYILKSLRS